MPSLAASRFFCSSSFFNWSWRQGGVYMCESLSD